MKTATVEDYLAGVPEPQRAALQALRREIFAAAPGACDCISYGMPAVRLDGVLVWYAAAKAHCAFYPSGLVEAFADQLGGYETSKGAIRFQPEKPIPTPLIHAIVARRIEQDQERAALRAAKRRR